MLPALRLFIDARTRAIKAGFTDNGGAIHSVERILDIMCQRLCYPQISHIKNLKALTDVECSVGAHEARLRGETIYIEHVMPQRAFARLVIDLVSEGISDAQLLQFLKANYRLVLLSRDETQRLNRLNRSRLSPDRIADASIELRRDG
jgi:hypothetical protein